MSVNNNNNRLGITLNNFDTLFGFIPPAGRDSKAFTKNDRSERLNEYLGDRRVIVVRVASLVESRLSCLTVPNSTATAQQSASNYFDDSTSFTLQKGFTSVEEIETGKIPNSRLGSDSVLNMTEDDACETVRPNSRIKALGLLGPYQDWFHLELPSNRVEFRAFVSTFVTEFNELFPNVQLVDALTEDDITTLDDTELLKRVSRYLHFLFSVKTSGSDRPYYPFRLTLYPGRLIVITLMVSRLHKPSELEFLYLPCLIKQQGTRPRPTAVKWSISMFELGSDSTAIWPSLIPAALNEKKLGMVDAKNGDLGILLWRAISDGSASFIRRVTGQKIVVDFDQYCKGINWRGSRGTDIEDILIDLGVIGLDNLEDVRLGTQRLAIALSDQVIEVISSWTSNNFNFDVTKTNPLLTRWIST
jgi:hypothetical protein